MEQKKTLWIVTAAGVFLAVVILAALILNKPTASSVPATASITTIERPSSRPVPQKTEEIVEADLPSVEPVSKEALDNLGDAENADVETVVEIKPEEGTVTIDVSQVSEVSAVSPKNETTAAAMESKKQSEKPATIYTASPVKKTTAEVNAEKKAEALNQAAKTTTVKTAAAPAPAKPVYVEPAKYWVQCASYTSKKTADNARSSLDENRIPAEVFTFKDAKNTLYYRVRVGPYTTKSEAEYWKNRIGQIDSFKTANAYITMN